MFINAAMTEADIDLAIAAADASFAAVKSKIAELEPHALLMSLMAAH